MDEVQCSHCGKMMSARQARRHKRKFVNGLTPGFGDPEAVLDNDGANAGNAGTDAVGVGQEGNANNLPLVPPLEGVPENIPVELNDTSDPEDKFVASDTKDIPIDSEDRDPDFEERDNKPGFHPNDEPLMTFEQARAMLELNLGDFADKEWEDMYSCVLSKKDKSVLQFLATHLRVHLSRIAYNNLCLGACKPLKFPSEYIAFHRLQFLSNLETRAYDCYIGSCICYVGKYAALASCSFCKKARCNSAGKARRSFCYTPLIPQLQALFQNLDMAKKLQYCSMVETMYQPGVIKDIFDGELYRTLRNTHVQPDQDYCYFDNPDNPNNIAVGLSMDGFTLFKRRRRGLSTAWPIMFIIYNLHPRYRTQMENVICVGVIPGPTQCKDLNSFLVPVMEEMLQLQDGVHTTKPAPAGDVDA